MKQLRSFLCGSPSRHDVSLKSVECGADVILFDLEDSVPEGKKSAVRQQILKQLKRKHPKPTAVRINGLESIYGFEDVLALVTEQVAPDIVIIPKFVSVAHAAHIIELLKEHFPAIRVFSVVETIEGLRALDRIANGCMLLDGLIFGSADFSYEMGIAPGTADFRFAQAEIAWAAAAINGAAIDAPCFSMYDLEAVAEQCHVAKTLGYVGKIAIHPSQVGVLNRCFSLSPDELTFAQSVMNNDTPDHDDKTISRVGSNMVGPPIRKLARKLLKLSQ